MSALPPVPQSLASLTAVTWAFCCNIPSPVSGACTNTLVVNALCVVTAYYSPPIPSLLCCVLYVLLAILCDEYDTTLPGRYNHCVPPHSRCLLVFLSLTGSIGLAPGCFNCGTTGKHSGVPVLMSLRPNLQQNKL